MCGICGIVTKDGSRPDQGLLDAANNLLAHRGPDDSGHFIDGPAGLAMRRLAIIDLQTGHQPLSYDDGRLWVVLNGEIYNYQELRSELEGRGHRFKTRTDTEVILALYQELGADCVKRLRGMFAFALWDKPKQRLLLARDRIGKKPLVYTDQPGFFAFASELRSLFVWPGVSRDVDEGAIDQYLSLQYIPSPHTIYRSARKLPPGHILLMEKGRIEIRKYWDLPLGEPPATRDPEEAKALVRDKLKEAVRLRMISDVPLGAFLSGGIDSSIVVALMSRFSDRPVRTFSIGFEEQQFSELPFARELAQRYGCDHTEFIVKADMAQVLPKLAWHYGEPYADSSALPSYYVARETRKHVTVALNGDGGDENFGGYIRYFAMKAARFFDLIPGPAQRGLKVAAELLPERDAPFGAIWRVKRFLRSALFADEPARYLKMIGYFSEEDKVGLYSPEFQARLARQGEALGYLAQAFSQGPPDDLLNRLLYVDFKTYLPENLMVKMDIATMANSLEGRSPLLDHEFVELVFRLPGEWKLRGLRGHKWLLKEAFKDQLPATIFNRGKMGFGIPLGEWFRGPLKRFWEEAVLGPEALKRGYFNEPALRRLWSEHQSGRREHGYRLWALLMLEMWHQSCASPAELAAR
ncbi:MAG: asparagine synthase (glutamine-hydrolyzing) [Elusimicrobia bacterium]|nr:asparagine synthase (glutamine-hydrolyzing) [Elusimicrobiota bacterium]